MKQLALGMMIGEPMKQGNLNRKVIFIRRSRTKFFLQDFRLFDRFMITYQNDDAEKSFQHFFGAMQNHNNDFVATSEVKISKYKLQSIV